MLVGPQRLLVEATMPGDEGMLSDRARLILGSVLFSAVWLLVAGPNLLQSLDAPKGRQSIGREGVPTIHSAVLLRLVLLAAIVAICLVLIVLSLPGVRFVRGAQFAMLLAPWAYLALRDGELGYGVGRDGLVYPLVVVTIYVLRPPLSSLRTIAHLTALTAVLSILMAVIKPSSAIFATGSGLKIAEDKQLLPWGLLEGFLTQPNILGLSLVLGLPAVLLLRAGGLRLTYVCVIAFALIWTASRSSIYTAVIGGVVTALCVWGRGSSVAMRRVITVMSALSMTAVLVVLPLVTSTPSAFTNRGYIWKLSLDAWMGSPWFGLGADWYSIIGSTSANVGGSVFHGHNEMVQALVTGGLLLAGLMTVLLLVLVLSAARWAARGEVFGTVYLVALLGSCWLEVTVLFVENSFYLGFVAIPMAVLLFAPDRDASMNSARLPHLSPA